MKRRALGKPRSDVWKPLIVGFTWALIGEITTGQSFTEQFSANSGSFFAAIQLWAFASLAPAFSSNEAWPKPWTPNPKPQCLNPKP